MLVSVLSTLLAAVFLAAGLSKVVLAEAVTGNLRRLGAGASLTRLIGALEIAAALGLAVGIWYTPLGVAAGTGLTLLLVGALAYHVRAGDHRNPRHRSHVLGPVILGLAVVVLTTAQLTWGIEA
ncbi:DoxX family protein [Plantactinospora sp. DSM 117369]